MRHSFQRSGNWHWREKKPLLKISVSGSLLCVTFQRKISFNYNYHRSHREFQAAQNHIAVIPHVQSTSIYQTTNLVVHDHESPQYIYHYNDIFWWIMMYIMIYICVYIYIHIHTCGSIVPLQSLTNRGLFFKATFQGHGADWIPSEATRPHMDWWCFLILIHMYTMCVCTW